MLSTVGVLITTVVTGLLIYYLSEWTRLDTRKERYTAEARTAFGGPVWVPDDLERIVMSNEHGDKWY